MTDVHWEDCSGGRECDCRETLGMPTTTAADTETADLLRRAATLIRQRANAATTGRWWEVVDGVYTAPEWTDGGWLSYDAVVVEATAAEPISTANLAHIASWDPTAALAVADWLDEAAEEWRLGVNFQEAALTVARAYLREDQP